MSRPAGRRREPATPCGQPRAVRSAAPGTELPPPQRALHETKRQIASQRLAGLGQTSRSEFARRAHPFPAAAPAPRPPDACLPPQTALLQVVLDRHRQESHPGKPQYRLVTLQQPQIPRRVRARLASIAENSCSLSIAPHAPCQPGPAPAEPFPASCLHASHLPPVQPGRSAPLPVYPHGAQAPSVRRLAHWATRVPLDRADSRSRCAVASSSQRGGARTHRLTWWRFTAVREREPRIHLVTVSSSSPYRCRGRATPPCPVVLMQGSARISLSSA